MADQNKIEALLSFKLDDKGLKDAEKELEGLQKKLANLSKQQADAGGTMSKRQSANLDREIKGTEAAIKLNRLRSGDTGMGQELGQAVQGRLKGRDPTRMLQTNLQDLVARAIGDVVGNIRHAMRDPAFAKQVQDIAASTAAGLGPRAPGTASGRATRRATNTSGETTVTVADRMIPAEVEKIPLSAAEQLQLQFDNFPHPVQGPESERIRGGRQRRGVQASNGAVRRPGVRKLPGDPSSIIPQGPTRPVTDVEEIEGPFNDSEIAGPFRPDAEIYGPFRGNTTLGPARQQTNATQGRFGAGGSNRLRNMRKHVNVKQGPLNIPGLPQVDTLPLPLSRSVPGGYDETEGPWNVATMPLGSIGVPQAPRIPGYVSGMGDNNSGMSLGPHKVDTLPLNPATVPGFLDRQGPRIPDYVSGMGDVYMQAGDKMQPGTLKEEKLRVRREEADRQRAAKAKADNDAKLNKQQNEQMSKEVEARRKLNKQLDATRPLTDQVAINHLRAANGPVDVAGQAEALQTAYTAVKGVQAAGVKAGDANVTGDASKALDQLSQSARSLHDSFVGAGKEAKTFDQMMGNINKKASLQQQREQLQKAITAEPEADARKEYAQKLNLNTKQLLDYESDPKVRRAMIKENNARNKEYGINADMMASFGQFLAGNVLLQTGRMARQPYQAAQQAYTSYNQTNQIDPALLSEQRRTQQGLIAMGSGMSGYNMLKAQTATALVTNPLAAPLAAAGEVGGQAAGYAGSLLQTGASLKMAGVSNKLLGSALNIGSGATLLGGAALAGGAVGMGVGSLISGALNNGKAKDPFDTLRWLFQPTETARNETEKAVGGNVRVLQGQKLEDVKITTGKATQAFKNYDAAVEQEKAYRALAAAEGNRLSPATLQLGIDADKKKIASQDDAKKYAQELAKAAGAEKIIDPVLNDPEKLRGVIKYFEDALNTTNVKKLLDANPNLKIQRQQMQNQWNDFTVDMARQTFQLNQNFRRQTEDLTKTRTRAKEDFGVNLNRLGVSRTRAGEDFDVSNRQNDLQIMRTRRDVGTQLVRLEEDQGKQRTRLVEDDTKSRQRLEEDSTKTLSRLYRDVNISLRRTTEDTTKSITRLQEDSGKSLQRAQEDSARTWQRAIEDAARTSTRTVEDANRTMTRAYEDAAVTMSRAIEDRSTSGGRLIEDTTLSRQRLSDDYNRNVTLQNRSYVRSNQDLDQGYQDSLLGIVAPGLSSNPGYQLMKLNRDYVKNKGRLGEDYETGRDDLTRSTDRAFKDLAKSLERGLADLEKSFARTVEDVNKSLTRTTEDIALNLARTTEDINTSLSRTAEDIAVSLGRAVEDTGTSIARAMEDIATSMSRASEDAAKAIEDGTADVATNIARTIQDLDTNLQRATQDLDIEHFRTYQDAMKGLQDAEVDYATNRAEIQKNYNRAIEDLNNAEFDLRRDYNRTVADLNTEASRAKEDFKFASDQLEIETQRFQRDFGLSVTMFANSVAEAAGSITSAVQSALNLAIIDIQNAGAAQAGIIAAAAAAGGAGGGSAPTGTPGLGGMDKVPNVNEFPALLHPGEMVITKGEAETLRQSGYRPESKNLDKILPRLMRDALPKFLGGWNGGSVGSVVAPPVSYTNGHMYGPYTPNGPDSDWDATRNWYAGSISSGAFNYGFQPQHGGVGLITQGYSGSGSMPMGGQYEGPFTGNSGSQRGPEPSDTTKTWVPVGTGEDGYTKWELMDSRDNKRISAAFNYSPGGSATNGVSSGSQWRGGYQAGHGGVGQITTGTSSGLTSGTGRGIISGNTSAIIPPTVSSSSARSQVGPMSINVQINGGDGRLQAMVNQATQAFGRDLSARIGSYV